MKSLGSRNMKILKSSFLILIFSGVAHILNYAYTLAAIHFLNPSEYAELALLVSIYSLIGIFGTTISNISLPLLHNTENTKIKNQVISTTKLLALFLFILSFTLFPFLVYKIFDVQNIQNIILFSLGGTATLASALLTTHFQVIKDFTKVGFIQIFATLIKFLGSLLFLYFGYKIFGVGLALLLSSILSFLIFFPWKQDDLITKNNTNIWNNSKSFYTEHKVFLIKSFLGSLVLTLLFSLDTLIAKKVLDESLVGYFVGLATLSKLFLFGIIAIGSVVFPYILSEKDENKKIQILNYFLAFTFFSGIIWLIIVYFLHATLVPLILGAKYLKASIYLFPISLFVVSASFAYIFTQLSILQNSKTFIKNILFYFLFFIISFYVFIKHLIPNINAVNINNLSQFLFILFAILAILLYNNCVKSPQPPLKGGADQI